jgi:hypothetical protein
MSDHLLEQTGIFVAAFPFPYSQLKNVVTQTSLILLSAIILAISELCNTRINLLLFKPTEIENTVEFQLNCTFPGVSPHPID